MDPPSESFSFRAGRDNRGAFATGLGSVARNIEAAIYIENYSDKDTERPSGPIYYDVPNLPDRYQSREEDVINARAKLLGSSSTVGITSTPRAVGLQGMGGIGKTVLATALLHDSNPDLSTAFPDGIVWLTFGRHMPALTKAAEFAFALTGSATSFSSLSEARAQLGLFTANRRLLVVLDDVWEQGAVDPFIGLGPGCRVLITTRDIRVLERARADIYRLDLLELDAARAFLAEATDTPVEALPGEADQIIRECGRLPLALAAVGALIREGTYVWRDALAALNEASLEEIDTSWLPDPEHQNLAIVLKLSVDALTDDARACLLDCAALREDIDVPEEVLLRLWSGRVPVERRTKLIAQELVARSLMHRDEQRRYRIHDLYMNYLHHIAAPLVDRHCHLISLFQRGCPDGWTTCQDDGYCVQHLAWHLREARQTEQLRSLLFDPNWIHRKLQISGVNSLLDDYGLLGRDPEALQLAAALTLSAHVLGPSPERVKAQLCGRLIEDDGPTIAKLLTALRGTHPASFLPIRHGYLTRPGALLRTIAVDRTVRGLAVLPHGSRALVSSDDTVLRLCDLETGAELRRYDGHESSVWAVATLSNGRRALSGSIDTTIRLWDLQSGTEVRRFLGHRGAILALAVLENGRRMLSGSEDNTLRLWDLESGTELRRFEGHYGPVGTIAVLTDGRRAVSGSDDYTLLVWDLGDGADLQLLEGHRGIVRTVAVLADGRHALSGSDDYTLRLWDLESGAELRKFEGHRGPVRTLAVTADGRRALSGSDDKTLRLWDLESGTELCRFAGHDGAIWTVAMLADGRRAVSGSDDKTLKLWDVESDAKPQAFEGHDDAVETVAVSPTGARALSGSLDTTLRLWDLESGVELRRFEGHTGRVSAVAMLADGRRALSGSDDATLGLWDIESGEELRRFWGHGGPILAIAVLADGRRAISGSLDSTVRLWDLESGFELRRFDGHSGMVWAVVSLADGRRALSGSDDSTLRLWDLASGTELHRFDAHRGPVGLVAALGDGRRALSGSDDGTLRLWDIELGTELGRLEGHRGSITTAVVLADGHSALSGSDDKTLRLWDLDGGAELRRFEGHCGSIGAVVALADGCRALSGSDDKTLRLWDLESGAELACFIGESAITAIGVSGSGRQAIAADARGRVMVFTLPL